MRALAGRLNGLDFDSTRLYNQCAPGCAASGSEAATVPLAVASQLPSPLAAVCFALAPQIMSWVFDEYSKYKVRWQLPR